MFFECSVVKLFRKDVLNWWNFKRSESINPSATEILYGYKPESTSRNHYRLIARYYIYLAKNKSETPKLEIFIISLKLKFNVKEKLKQKTEILSNTEISGSPYAFLIRVVILKLIKETCGFFIVFVLSFFLLHDFCSFFVLLNCP